MEDSENRRALRVNIANEVVMEYGGRSVRASAMDLSRRGMSVWAPGTATGVPIRLTMALTNRPVILRGRVARQFESDDGAVWGIEFSKESDADSLAIVHEYFDAAEVA